MKKYCPFCDSELSETLWCEQCRRYAILYNTHDAAGDTCDDNEAERMELYRQLTAALKNLYAAKSKYSASAPTSKPVLSAVPEEPKKNSEIDTPKIILFGSMLLVCLILCLMACARLMLKHDAEPSDTIRSTQSDTQSWHIAERVSEAVKESVQESVQEPAETIPPETPTESAAESSAQPTGDVSAEADDADWRLLEQLDPLELQVWGDTKYYYYAVEDIEALGIQCTYYHLGITHDEVANEIIGFFGEAASEEEPYDYTYFNFYADSDYEYYTSFQKVLSYDCGGLNCYINYDTGSDIVHFFSFSGAHIEDYIELIQTLSALVSQEYTLSPEGLRESILSTEDILSHLDPPDMWHEEYVYQDSCISLSMNYYDDIYELQVTSRKYADDVVQNTLSISRPK